MGKHIPRGPKCRRDKCRLQIEIVEAAPRASFVPSYRALCDAAWARWQEEDRAKAASKRRKSA